MTGETAKTRPYFFATLTLIMGYGTVYIHPPDHYAAGILGSGLRGNYWEYPEGSNKTYYYCETTGNNFKIGQLPIEFQEQGVYIYAIDENRQFAPAIVVMPTAEPTQIPVTTESTGPANPTPTSTAQPDVTGPTVLPFMPLSFNLIYESPALFVIIISAIVVSLALAVWSVRRPKLQSAYEPVPPPTDTKMSESIDSGENKFCIFAVQATKTRSLL